MTDETRRGVKRLLWIAAALAIISILSTLFNFIPGCGVEPKRKIVIDQPPSAATGIATEPAATCGELKVGDTKELGCTAPQVGRHTQYCNSAGKLVDALNTCADPARTDQCGPDKTTFATVQPVLTRSCNSCHTGYDSFAKAKSEPQEYLRRFRLPLADPQHMPKGAQLTDAEIKTVNDWVADGLCPAPTVQMPSGQAFQSFVDSENAAVADATDTNKVDIEDRPDTRYVAATDVIDAGGTADQLAQYKQAVEKALNSLSTERLVGKVTDVSPGVWRFDISDFGISARQWAAIENADLVNIESFTSRGILLKLLTKSRKPLMHVESLIDAAARNTTVYYDLVKVPSTFALFTAQIGVDYAGDLRKRDVVLSAFTGSPLSLHNRMISIHKSRDGFLVCTYDTGPQDEDQKNFINFPLLPDIGGVKNAKFLAGECIDTLPNGMQRYTLWNAKQTNRGVPRVVNGRPVLDANGRQIVDIVFVRSDLDLRADVGNVNVVRDFLSPTSSEIRSGISCFRCHAPGLLPVRDQIRGNVIANGAQFGNDRDLILDVYKEQPKMDAKLAEENGRYNAAIKQVNVAGTTAADEPVTRTSDAHLLPWSQKKVCATLWVNDGDCRVLLNQSATAQAQWGQLGTGGSIAFDQFVASLPAVIQELRLFQDPI